VNEHGRVNIVKQYSSKYTE